MKISLYKCKYYFYLQRKCYFWKFIIFPKQIAIFTNLFFKIIQFFRMFHLFFKGLIDSLMKYEFNKDSPWLDPDY